MMDRSEGRVRLVARWRIAYAGTYAANAPQLASGQLLSAYGERAGGGVVGSRLVAGHGAVALGVERGGRAAYPGDQAESAQVVGMGAVADGGADNSSFPFYVLGRRLSDGPCLI